MVHGSMAIYMFLCKAFFLDLKAEIHLLLEERVGSICLMLKAPKIYQ